MKNNNQMKPLAKFIAASLAVGSIAGFGAQALAQTAAGTLIKNLATVTYEDENGNSYSAQSNEAVVTVAPVYSATIDSDHDLSGAPGQTVYFPHTLSNTGNIEDLYDLATDNGALIYLDENGNGQPDAGEEAITEINIPAGEQVSLVVAVPIPTSATDTTVITTVLTTTSANLTAAGDGVTDGTDAAGGQDSNAVLGTNHDNITVSTGPVLVLNKSSVHNEAANTVTYTLTVKNTGGSPATNVDIIDPLPRVDTDGDGVLDAQLSFVSMQVNGILTANGDSVPTGTVTNASGFEEISATDVTLPPNTTVSIEYTASYDLDGNPLTPITWDAGTVIDNTFTAESDEITTPVSSNTTNDLIPQNFAVSADDTNADASPIINDGGDDDSTTPAGVANDIQFVDSAPTGSDVLFKHIVTNNGNGDDAFNLDVANTDFPAGTVFTYWDSTGTVQLTDTDNDGVPDTGLLATGASETIMIKAKLPAGISDATPGAPADYNAVLTATSSADPSSTPATDVTNLKLGSILVATVDIANGTIVAGTATPPATGESLSGFNDLGIEDAHDQVPVLTETGTVGGTVVFDLILANESGNSDSFLLDTASVPTGWSVVFKDGSGNVITTTPLVPGEGTFAYTAEVTVSEEATEALSSPDYQVAFTATSSTSPAITDTVTDAVDIELAREVVITPNGQNQVQPGGTVDYTHLVENNGNQPETVELNPSNTQDGWTTIINVDTDGDGIPDEILNPLSLTPTSIKGIDADGNVVSIAFTDTDGDGYPELVIPPGVDVAISTTVSAPSDAPLGAVDLSTVTVYEGDGGTELAPTAVLDDSQDQTTVMLGQVRLEKKAAIDPLCNGTLLSNASGVEFLADQPTQVAPGECVVWQLTAVNEGTATVKNVKISDAAPAFTDILMVGGVPALKFCQGNGCVPAGVTAPADGGTYGAGLVNFYAINGPDADPASDIGGELIPGETMTGEFTVKVQ